MVRIATFNVENLDANSSGSSSTSLDARIPILRGYLKRIDADILCLQEVHGQELPSHTRNNPRRDFSSLDEVVAGTKYVEFKRAHTVTSDNVPYDKRNLLVLVNPEYDLEFGQYLNSEIEALQYKKVTANPSEIAKEVSWERPILHAKVLVPQLGKLHVLNLHLKSRLASNVTGQKNNKYSWRSAAGWAEGYFLSSIKRVGQALETRVLLDKIFDQEPNAKIVVCGDFNAEPGEVPVEAICGRVENTGNAALVSRVLVPCARAIPESIRFTHLHHGDGNLLDHILMSQSLLNCFRSAEIHNENLHDESLPFASDKKYPESDHAPFVAEFKI